MKIFSIKLRLFNLIVRLKTFYRPFSPFHVLIKFVLVFLNYDQVYRVSVLMVIVANYILRLLLGLLIFFYVRGIKRKIQTSIFITMNCSGIFIYMDFITSQFHEKQNTYMGDKIMHKIKSNTQTVGALIFFGFLLALFMILTVDAFSNKIDESVIVSKKWIYRAVILNITEI